MNLHEYLLYKNRTSNWEGDGCCWLLPLVFDCRCCKIFVVEFVACIVKMLLLRSKIHHSYSDHFQIGLLRVMNRLFLKFQNRFTHAKLRGRYLIFRHCPIIRTCTFTWTGQNKICRPLANFRFYFDREPFNLGCKGQ